MYISLIIQVIGDLREVKEAHMDYKTAVKKAEQIQKDTHARGYTDFRYIVNQYPIVESSENGITAPTEG